MTLASDRNRQLVRSGLFHLFQSILSPLPIEFSILKRFLLRLFGAKIGKGVLISDNAWIEAPWDLTIAENSWIDREATLICGRSSKPGRLEIRKHQSDQIEAGKLVIGRDCHIAVGVVIQAHGGATIGDSVGIASGAKLYTLSHHYRHPDAPAGKVYKFTPRAPPEDQCVLMAPIRIEDNAAIGLNTVVLPGVTIGTGSWVAAQSLVTSDIPPHCVARGIPAQITRRIGEP